jgi:ABC-type branched-subunit amino acid transport system substrate-binding protein
MPVRDLNQDPPEKAGARMMKWLTLISRKCASNKDGFLMTSFSFIRAVLLACVGGTALFIGCAVKVPEPKRTVEAVQRDIFDEAEAFRLKGDIERAEKSYGEYLASHPSGLRAAISLHRLADMSASRGDERTALSLYRRAAVAEPTYEALPEVRFQIARLLSLTGDFNASNLEAETWLSLYPRHARRGDVLMLLADNAASMGSRRASFGYLIKAATEYGDERGEGAALRKRIEDYLSTADVYELKDLASDASGSPYAPFAYYRLARLLMEREDFTGAEEALTRLAVFRNDPDWDRKLLDLSSELKERKGTKNNVVGCLLPLSGPFAQFGQEVLQGLQLAIMKETGPGCALELALRDTAGEIEGTGKALREIVEQEKAIAAIGLFSSKEAQYAAQTAQDIGIPLLALTQKEGITGIGDRIFRFFPTASQEVESLLSWAVDVLGISRFAVLYPDNAYGRHRAEVFRGAAEARGASVASIGAYPENETDFESVIKDLIKPKASQAKGTSRLGPEEEQTVLIQGERAPIGFEGLFIPDKGDTIKMLAPQLLYHEVAPLALLGTGLWQHQKVIEEAGDYLPSALIPSSYFEGMETPLAGRFNEGFKSSYGNPPGLLSSLGFDAVRILAKVLCERKVLTRREAADAIRNLGEFQTLRGIAACTPTGEITQASPLLTISKGRFVQATPP